MFKSQSSYTSLLVNFDLFKAKIQEQTQKNQEIPAEGPKVPWLNGMVAWTVVPVTGRFQTGSSPMPKVHGGPSWRGVPPPVS